MRSRVRRLRLFGVQSTSQEWHFGYVQMGKGVMTLSALGSSPGMGLMDQLYKPEILSWTRNTMRVRGIEPVLQEEGVASYLQEWEIDLATSEPEGDKARGWVAPGLFQPE